MFRNNEQDIERIEESRNEKSREHISEETDECSPNSHVQIEENRLRKEASGKDKGARPKERLANVNISFGEAVADTDLSKMTEDNDNKIGLDQQNASFFRYIADFAQAKAYGSQAKQIAECVYRCVEKILIDTAKEDGRFQHSELLKVGSFYEGTKVIEPNEFDFLVVIEELSQPGAITVAKEGILSGCIEISLADKTMKERWSHDTETDVLHNFQEFERSHSFGSTVLSCLAKMAVEQTLEYELSEYGYINLVNAPISFPPINDTCLMLYYAEVWNPNVVLKFKYNGMTISADLSPAIRYHNVSDCFNPEDCIDDKVAEAVLNRNSILLVNRKTWDTSDRDPDHEHIFRVTFTETEVHLVKEMRLDHKQLYIFLKYLIHTFHDVSKRLNIDRGHPGLSTYMLKQICLFHDITCCLPSNVNMNFCLFNILHVFLNFYESRQCRSIFNTKVQLCKGTGSALNGRQKMLYFLASVCIHKIQPPLLTEDFNLTNYIESTFLEAIKDKNLSLVHIKEELAMALAISLSGLDIDTDEIISSVKENSNARRSHFFSKTDEEIKDNKDFSQDI